MNRVICLTVFAALCTGARAAEISVPMTSVDQRGIGASVGTVKIVETPYGLVFRPELKGLKPGLHGFHIHENPSCGPATKDGKTEAAGAAGEHLDPAGSKKHGEPWGDGHLGDLPALYVAPSGTAGNPVLAPRLKLSDVANRSLMIHMGGDNHADHPARSGGGGERLACGVIKG